MFNRTIELKVIKPKKTQQPEQPVEDGYLEKVVYTTQSAKSLLDDAVKIVGAYILFDTFRKVMIELAKK